MGCIYIQLFLIINLINVYLTLSVYTLPISYYTNQPTALEMKNLNSKFNPLQEISSSCNNYKKGNHLIIFARFCLNLYLDSSGVFFFFFLFKPRGRSRDSLILILILSHSLSNSLDFFFLLNPNPNMTKTIRR